MKNKCLKFNVDQMIGCLFKSKMGLKKEGAVIYCEPRKLMMRFKTYVSKSKWLCK